MTATSQKGCFRRTYPPLWTARHEITHSWKKSVRWIETVAPSQHYPNLLDLGCGPGIYAALFDDVGYKVTGVDVSERSIQYARNATQAKGKEINYQVSDYLALDYSNQFDIVTLIYCDFGVLSTENRKRLLENIYAALRPNGIFLFDVFTPLQYAGQDEYRLWEYDETGFWSESPYIRLESLYQYNGQNTFLRQYLVMTEYDVNCYNIWEHTFTQDELMQDLTRAGFRVKGFYGDVAGGPHCTEGKQICIIAEK